MALKAVLGRRVHGRWNCMCLRGMRGRFTFTSEWDIADLRCGGDSIGQTGSMRSCIARSLLFCNGDELLLAEYVSHAANLGAYPSELLLEVFVAAIEVVDPVEDGLSVRDQSGEDERRGGAKV